MPSASISVQVLDLAGGLCLEPSGSEGTTAGAWRRGDFECPEDATHFGFILGGPTTLEAASGEFNLAEGMYFCVPGKARVRGGQGLVISQHGVSGFFHLGGPVEEHGRLRYIDGCSDSLLIPPVRRGDPCLNLLYVPPGVSQTEHTHPSVRIGLIVSGAGRCETDSGPKPLRPGSVFVIPPGARHSFHTGDDKLLIIAYHPDSDFGPTDENHPMINRTLIPEPVNSKP